MRRNSGCLLVTIAFVFTKHPVELRLVILPLRGASGVAPKVQERSVIKRVCLFLSSTFVTFGLL
jgi:hypothetical protein